MVGLWRAGGRCAVGNNFLVVVAAFGNVVCGVLMDLGLEGIWVGSHCSQSQMAGKEIYWKTFSLCAFCDAVKRQLPDPHCALPHFDNHRTHQQLIRLQHNNGTAVHG